MLIISGVEDDPARAHERCDKAVVSGQAAERFDEMCAALGGPAGFVTNSARHLATAPVTRPVYGSGFLAEVDVRAVGNAIIELGGGRRKVGEALYLSVGFSNIAVVGKELDRSTPLAVIHAANEDDAAAAEKNLLAAVSLGQEATPDRPVICEILTG